MHSRSVKLYHEISCAARYVKKNSSILNTYPACIHFASTVSKDMLKMIPTTWYTGALSVALTHKYLMMYYQITYLLEDLPVQQ